MERGHLRKEAGEAPGASFVPSALGHLPGYVPKEFVRDPFIERGSAINAKTIVTVAVGFAIVYFAMSWLYFHLSLTGGVIP